MNSTGGNWRIALQENIRSSEEKLQRLRGRQENHETARKMLTAALETHSEVDPDAPPRKLVSPTEFGDSLHHLQSRLNNCVAEIEMERTVRCDGIQRLQQHVSNQVGELQAMFLQLKNENEYLSEMVRSLEKRMMPTSSSAAAVRADGGADGRGNENCSPVVAAVAVSGLTRRVEELESTVTRQRRVIEDRQTRLDGVLREMVNVKVATEVERMRTIARDAARESTEDLVRLRLSAVQSMFNTELQKMMESTGVSSEVARATERLFRKMEADVMHRLHDVNFAVDAIKRDWEKRESTFDGVEQRIMQRFSEVEHEVEATRREMKDSVARNAQASDASATTAKLELEACITERIRAVCRNLVSKDDVAAAVAGSHERLQQQYTDLREGLVALQQGNEASGQRCGKQMAHLEERLGGLQDTSEMLQRRFEHTEKLVKGIREEVEQWKPRICEALSASEEAHAFAQESLISAQKKETTTREGIARSSVQLQTLAEEQEMSAALLRQLNDKIAAIDARHAAARVVIDELSERNQSTLLPLNAKFEALQRTVHDGCVPKIEELGQSVSEIRALSEQMQANVSSKAKSDARQLSDLRREVSTGVEEVEERVMQALRDWRHDSAITAKGLKSSVDNLNTVLRTHEQQLFTHKDAVTVTSADLEALVEKLRVVDAKLDAVSRRGAQEETTSTPSYLAAAASASASANALGVGGEVKQQLEELGRRVDGVEHNIATRLGELQRQMPQQREQLDAKLQEQVAHFNELLHRMREENSSQMQNLRTLLGEQVEDRCRRVLEDAQSNVQRQQIQLDRLRDMLGAKQFVSAVCDDKELQHELADALRDSFAPRGDTSDFLLRNKKRIQQIEFRLSELESTHAAQERELAHQTEVCEALQRSHPEHVATLEKRLRHEVAQFGNRCGAMEERLASVEAEQQKATNLWERWYNESRKEDKQEMVLFTSQMEERIKELQNITSEAEKKAHSVQLDMRKLREEHAMLKIDVAKVRAVQEAEEARTSTADGRRKSRENDDDNDEDFWRASMEERIDAVEAKMEAVTHSTADALDGLHEGVQQCVALFVQEVTSSSSTLFQHSDAEWPEREAIAAVSGLDGVLVFIWQQICALYATLQTLQDGALGTLDLLQHHEERLSMLPAIQSLAVRNAGHVSKLAAALGLPLAVHIEASLVAESEEEDGATEAGASPEATFTLA